MKEIILTSGQISQINDEDYKEAELFGEYKRA
jgi:hypothetical protein